MEHKIVTCCSVTGFCNEFLFEIRIFHFGEQIRSPTSKLLISINFCDVYDSYSMNSFDRTFINGTGLNSSLGTTGQQVWEQFHRKNWIFLAKMYSRAEYQPYLSDPAAVAARLIPLCTRPPFSRNRSTFRATEVALPGADFAILHRPRRRRLCNRCPRRWLDIFSNTLG